MPAKRKLIKRAQRQQITAAILELFRHWQATGDDFPLAQALGCNISRGKSPWRTLMNLARGHPGRRGMNNGRKRKRSTCCWQSPGRVLIKIAIGDSDQINFRFGPLCGHKSDIPRGPRSATSRREQSQQRSPSFDHLVGAGEH